MGISRIFKNFQSCQEDLGVMLELWYTDSELLLYILTGCPHSQAPQARSVVETSEPRGEREWELKKPVHSEKVFATRKWEWYQSNTWQRITVKTINTVKQPIYTIWPKWSKCYRMNISIGMRTEVHGKLCKLQLQWDWGICLAGVFYFCERFVF